MVISIRDGLLNVILPLRGTQAALAGLKMQDRIVKIGTREIKNVYDYTYALGEMKAGQEYVVEVMRGTEKLTLKITPIQR